MQAVSGFSVSSATTLRPGPRPAVAIWITIITIARQLDGETQQARGMQRMGAVVVPSSDSGLANGCQRWRDQESSPSASSRDSDETTF